MIENTISYKETDSTNTRLRSLVNEGTASCGMACVAESQTSGKGRNGRSFFSPSRSGIYLSVFICPKVSGPHIATISAIASVCVIRAIKEVVGVSAGIKWINDIYLEGKKVGGILCEIISVPSGSIKGVVVGVGLNCSIPESGFPKELKDIAGYLNIKPEEKALLTKKIIEHLRTVSAGGVEWLSDYKENSIVLGKDILVLPSADKPYRARAMDIDNMGALLVTDEDGEVKRLFSGEISIRF